MVASSPAIAFNISLNSFAINITIQMCCVAILDGGDNDGGDLPVSGNDDGGDIPGSGIDDGEYLLGSGSHYGRDLPGSDKN